MQKQKDATNVDRKSFKMRQVLLAAQMLWSGRGAEIHATMVL